MTKEEIKAGLRNALERGENLAQAMQSFANAGYNVPEIQQAAQELQYTYSSNQQVSEQETDKKEEAIKKQSFFKRFFRTKEKKQIPKIQEPIDAPHSQQKEKPDLLKIPPAPNTPEQKQLQEKEQGKRKRKTWIVVLLIFILIILFGILFLIFLGENILKMFFAS